MFEYIEMYVVVHAEMWVYDDCIGMDIHVLTEPHLSPTDIFSISFGALAKLQFVHVERFLEEI